VSNPPKGLTVLPRKFVDLGLFRTNILSTRTFATYFFLFFFIGFQHLKKNNVFKDFEQEYLEIQGLSRTIFTKSTSFRDFQELITIISDARR